MPKNQYDQIQRKLEGDDSAPVDGTELQDLADGASEAGEDALNRARAAHGLYDQLPDATKIEMLSHRLEQMAGNQQALISKMADMQGEFNDKVSSFEDDLSNLRAKQKRYVIGGSLVFAVLGLGFVAGGSYLAIQLAALLKAAEESKKPSVDPAQEGGQAEDPKDADENQDPTESDDEKKLVSVSSDILEQWIKLPNEMLYDAIEKSAFAEDAEWSIKTWNFVTNYLLMLISNRDAGQKTIEWTKTAAQVQSDFDDWRDKHDLDARYIWNKSGTDAPVDADGITELQLRIVRLRYLAEIFQLAQDLLNDG